MVSSDRLDSLQSPERWRVHEGHIQLAHLELARRIVHETMAADRQAMELDGKLISAVQPDKWFA